VEYPYVGIASLKERGKDDVISVDPKFVDIVDVVLEGMVRRQLDSRLLANLLLHEKEYIKHLHSLLDSSLSSQASFSAYAAASSPPTSHVILAVAVSLAGVDEAFRGYVAAVEKWRDHLKSLKNLEDEVGTIMRNRETL
jgi:hypothetical protein